MFKKGWIAIGLAMAITLRTSQSVHAAAQISDTALKTAVAHMSLRRQLGQLFIAYAPAQPKAAEALVAKYHVGGLVLFGVDFQQGSAATKKRIAGYQKASEIPLLIATDQEGGSVSRLSGSPDYAGQPWQSPQEAYYRGGMPQVLQVAQAMQKALHQVGVNWNFAPLADVAPDPHSYIYDRTMGLGYQGTAAYIHQVIPKMQQNQVAATLKHFPGYGDVGNTHTDFAADDRSLAQLADQDLLPFKAGIRQGVDAIMVTHIMLTALDDHYPASLSRRVVTGLLRHQLNYHGVIITDGLEMDAITDFAQAQHLNADVAALKAGNDCLLNDDYATGIPALAKAVKKGEISRQQVAASVLRVLQLKRKLGLLSASQFPPAQVRIQKHHRTANQVTVQGQVYAAHPKRLQAVVAGHTVASTKLDQAGRFRLRLQPTNAVQTVRLQAAGAAAAKLTIPARPVIWPKAVAALVAVVIVIGGRFWLIRRQS